MDQNERRKGTSMAETRQERLVALSWDEAAPLQGQGHAVYWWATGWCHSRACQKCAAEVGTEQEGGRDVS